MRKAVVLTGGVIVSILCSHGTAYSLRPQRQRSQSHLASLISIRSGQHDRVGSVGLHAQTEGMPEKKKVFSLPTRTSTYNLVWSQGFPQKFLITTIVLFVLRATGVSTKLSAFVPRQWHTVVSASMKQTLNVALPDVILPLLSSSCCLLQLVINSLAGVGGCAGFNTFLGPIRPFFLSLFLYFNTVSTPTLQQGLLRGSLALLPEIVYFWNSLVAFQWKRTHQESQGQAKSQGETVLELDIPTMGCVACINKIESSLRQSSPNNIVSVESWLNPGEKKGGQARISTSASSQEDIDSLAQNALNAVAEAGFGGATVASVKKPN